MSKLDQKEELETYLHKGIPTQIHPDYLTPVQSMSPDYRKKIEKGCSTGWHGLDDYLIGIRKGELTVITADTGVGKTTFAMNLIYNCACKGIKTWINSWEMSPAMTYRKLASLVLKKPMKMIAFTDEDTRAYLDWAAQHTVHINESTTGTDITCLSKQLIEARKVGVEVVMLDHLDYLINHRKEKVHEAIEDTMKRLHELALAMKMHFLLICHPRQVITSTEEIGMHSLKGSASIKQYADNVIILHRCIRTSPTADPRKTKVTIGKNRMLGKEGFTYLYYEATWDGYSE